MPRRTSRKSKRRRRKLQPRTITIIVVAVVFALAGLGIGLYFGLRKKSSKTQVPEVPYLPSPPATKSTIIEVANLVSEKRIRMYPDSFDKQITVDGLKIGIEKYRKNSKGVNGFRDDDLTFLVRALKTPKGERVPRIEYEVLGGDDYLQQLGWYAGIFSTP